MAESAFSFHAASVGGTDVAPRKPPTPDQWIDGLPDAKCVWAIVRVHVDCYCNDVVAICESHLLANQLARQYVATKNETHGYMVEAMPIYLETP